MQLLDGSRVSAELFSTLYPRVEALKQKGIHTKLVFFLIGNNPASVAYVGMKQKACEQTGIISEVIRYDESVTQKELFHRIEELNHDDSVHGIMVQLPLPKHLPVSEVTKTLNPYKDADGFHAYNFGKMAISRNFEHLPPATALGIIRLLDAYQIDVSGMNVVVLGRSNLVGKPIGLMLLNRGATVTICHSKTKNPASFCQNADLIVAATGVPLLVKGDWVKEGVIVVDAGYAKVDGKTVGDVDFDAVKNKCSMITPVPGGVGPMTIYSIVENTVSAAERQVEKMEI
ncbi:MAG: bifunctional 5,10-methylenetetrahydrofolate dehydrogenase/5,10-methenyltetrahydrofolate cyclohydrolase [Candidatus Gracilibacteria bacterium]|nr:bifunctional 5,10-methylenetetrahydrofolate dehydrogenase/5,10-methenyltetrahydrofolate cyclohydrolase [bacterium]MDZ4216856.1 bifunctional 5,10-methylenetetrahydrofolate dehydrogenase/5,10-methenyltetrahydrofolate cyclohydrolase [Candidatus Gracilibacteria bacterium]